MEKQVTLHNHTHICTRYRSVKSDGHKTRLKMRATYITAVGNNDTILRVSEPALHATGEQDHIALRLLVHSVYLNLTG